MTTFPETPAAWIDALAEIVPGFRDEWEPGETADTFHAVFLRFTPCLGLAAGSLPAEMLGRLGALLNAAVDRGGPVGNAVETCLIEHLGQIRAWRTLRPYLSPRARGTSRR